MPEISAERMKSQTPGVSSILWSEWVDLPDKMMHIWPDLREWNRLSKARDEANREKIVEFILRLQKPSEEGQ